MPFEFKKLEIPEILLITPRVWSDRRGSFSETYKHSDFAAVGAGDIFVQENHSSSMRGVLRGLHFQRPPRAQSKLIRVLSGEIFDVAVDLRPDSPTRGKWVGAVLSAETRTLMYVPGWCAHGFCVLSERADVLYRWPISNPIVSDRDQQWPLLS